MKKIIFYSFIFILLLPSIQWRKQLIQIPPLQGVIVATTEIPFSIKNWFSAGYQENKETTIKETIGFRPVFVRSYNQLYYSLFRMAKNPEGVVGKDDYLFLSSYIYNFTGENFVGNEKIHSTSERLKYLQDFFSSKNITLLTLFLPSKASYFAEYIPDKFKLFPENNYSSYCKQFDSLNLNYIDLNKYFLQIKDRTPYPLFPKNGLHWTSYGMALGMDSLIKKIESLKKIDLPDFSWKEPVTLSQNYREPDNDAENLMNLFMNLPRESMPYPEFIFATDSTKTKQKTLVISDSYYWQAYLEHIPHEVFDWGGFWYYFNTARQVDNNHETVVPVTNLDLQEKLLDQDVIVLFASQATLHLFPYGFDKKAYQLFQPFDTAFWVEHYRQAIISDSVWKNSVQEKAEKSQITFNEQLDKDAEWMALNEKKKTLEKEFEIEAIINRIRSDSKWLQSVREKAAHKNISLDEMLRKDAEWLFNSENVGSDTQ